MSGPVQPPLTVETVDGATVGRPITKIKVSNGTLSILGSTATITTGGGGGGTGTVTSVSSSQAFITIANPTTTPSISIGNASGAATGVLTASDFNTFDAKQDAITLTTTGTSGAATFSGGTLNIPQYSATTGTVTSVALTKTGTALTITGSPITGSGTFEISGAGTSSQVILGDLSLGTLTSGTVTGTGSANQVSYWTSASAQAGSTGLTYDPSTGNLTVGGYVETGTKVTTSSGTNLTLDTNNGTDSGSIVIANGANGQIVITPNGTGTIKLDGVELDNSLIQTGYVLKATSATGAGWAAESGGGGGGNEFNLELPGTDTNSGNNDLYLVSRMPGWGSNYSGSGTLNNDENPYFWPWISPLTGNITCCIDVTFDGSGTLAIAIYTDENGVPKTKIGGDASYAFGSTGTGYKELSFSSAVSVTRGTQYWIGMVESSIGNGAIRSENGSNSYSASPRFNSPSNLSSVTSTGVSLSNSDNTLPSSITASDLESNSRGQPRWGIRV